jgi:hypothetical protein
VAVVDKELPRLKLAVGFYDKNRIRKGQGEGKFLWLTADCWQRIVQVVIP